MKKTEGDKQKILDTIDDEPTVFAIPCDMPFIVDSSKAKEFNELEPNTELIEMLKESSKKLNIKMQVETESIEYQVYACSPKILVTIPFDPEREKKDLENYEKFIKKMKEIEEEKAKFAKEQNQKEEGPVLKKVNKPNK